MPERRVELELDFQDCLSLIYSCNAHVLVDFVLTPCYDYLYECDLLFGHFVLDSTDWLTVH